MEPGPRRVRREIIQRDSRFFRTLWDCLRTMIGLMRRVRADPRVVLAVLTTVSASQLGHLISYFVRFGPGALAAQSTGVHAYYPSVGVVAGGLGGAAILFALSAIALARLIAGRAAGLRVTSGWRIWELFAALFTIQLAIYASQETLESILGNAPVAGALSLILLGSIGQLPAAFIAAVAISWISKRFGGAVVVLRAAMRHPVIRLNFAVPVQPIRAGQTRLVVLTQSSQRSLAKRGPPPTLLSH